MAGFPVHTIESAPQASQPALRNLQAAFGVLPNILGAMSTSPVLINSLAGLFKTVHGGSFTEAEIQALLLTNAVTNASPWAVAFHTALSLKEGLNPSDVDALRTGRSPSDTRLAGLSALARRLIETRGHLDGADIESFVASGYRADLGLEVIAVVAASTITNYTGTVTRTPLEPSLQPHAWQA